MATIPWLLALAPAVLALAATWPIHSSQGSARSMSKLASGAAIAAALAALAGATLYFGTGAAGEGALIGRLGASGLALTLYVDTLTVVMAVLVSGVGAAVVLYSRTYLDGDPRHAHFMRWLCLTLAAVLLLVLSGNLLQFALAWAATSLCLHQLLVFYRDRPQAQIAARKKFIVSRLGDVGLLAAVAIALGHFGTLDFDALFRAA
ncbi:MAG TPA: proton-conducting transporter membrane subunit, partial [Steroidobacteraceae bacterium]|nr:proton-conducting transporter membrane subunit [Steroidobacteraceae bacterium]